MSHVVGDLKAFVPAYVLERLAAPESRPSSKKKEFILDAHFDSRPISPVGDGASQEKYFVEEFGGVAMFADLSGFSTLADRLVHTNRKKEAKERKLQRYDSVSEFGNLVKNKRRRSVLRAVGKRSRKTCTARRRIDIWPFVPKPSHV